MSAETTTTNPSESEQRKPDQAEIEADSIAKLEALGYSGSLKHFQERNPYMGADGVVEGMIDGLSVTLSFGRSPTGSGVSTREHVATVDQKEWTARIGTKSYDDDVAKELWHRLLRLAYPDHQSIHPRQRFATYEAIPGSHEPEVSDRLKDKLLSDERLAA